MVKKNIIEIRLEYDDFVIIELVSISQSKVKVKPSKFSGGQLQ